MKRFVCVILAAAVLALGAGSALAYHGGGHGGHGNHQHYPGCGHN